MKRLSRKALSLEQSQTLALFARAKKMKSEGIDVVSLTAGEPDFPTPEPIKQAAIEAIRSNFTKYTANQGIIELREAVAKKLKRDSGLDFSPAEILVSSGAKHSVYNALAAIVNGGDEVIIPSPYWVSYPEMVKLVDGNPVIVKTSASSGFKMSAKQLRKAITKRTKAMIFNSPCNPTGVVYTPEEIAAIADVVRKAGIYVISDEIYEYVIYGSAKHSSMGALPGMRDLVLTVNGVSKAYSMTGWRIGFLAGNKQIIEQAEKVQGQVTSNASSVSQKAALAAMTFDLMPEVERMVGEFDRRRNRFMELLGKIEGLGFIVPDGAFYLYVDVGAFEGGTWEEGRVTDSEAISEFLLKKYLVAAVPGTGFGNKHWMRLSYACSMEELEKGAERLRFGLGELSELAAKKR